MPQLIFALCALTAAACAGLLLRSFMRSRSQLLFWSGLCFVGLTINNLLLIADRWLFPDVNLLPLRHASALAAVLLLIYGLVRGHD